MTEDKEKRIRHALGKVDNVVNILVRIAMIPILVCGCYILADTIGIYANASPQRVPYFKPEPLNAETLKQVSKDCIAWIQIDGTSIDYPIMQADNNTRFLNEDPYGKYSLSGSIFMDYRNAADFSDNYSIVYGHHMSAGLMFGALDAYASESYLKEHSKGTLTVGDTQYDLSVHAFFRCDASHGEVFDPYDGLTVDRTRFFEDRAWHKNGKLGDRVVALTTCKSPGATDRTVLIVNIEKRGD